ncbi:sporulation-specific diadenylate cyclase CdaS [Cohnella silvisoli]|uniref:Diadenylate cyclase n=1 Tax=Cohnella silvisoli TaxID=2873699 RepID=A0ABV1L1A1_9BACL|nr:sporulation-specific diadenylate cyclase CdaS [Cohnella silvisoli]MCD9025488.1 sporulation-specific diadenylate cyclase CdaS [Cohnella silvisoli]
MTTPSVNCDFSPMKRIIKEDLHQMTERLQQLLRTLDDENDCLLGEFEKIKKNFFHIESSAATFYLNCYLSPYIERYMDLSLCIKTLSERRHGALIAVERNDSIESLLQPGIMIGAPITHSLLESIFYPGSPLHDGAILIRSNQIVSAKNILPLTTTRGNDRITGTRHRAAVGLSELTDAIVLVVSEETGKASFANKGQLYPVITP